MPSWPMVITFLVIGAAIISYALERLTLEITSIATLGALLLLFHFMPGDAQIAPERLLAGFADPALMTILALLVLGQGLFHTGALEVPASHLVAFAKGRPKRVIGAAMVIVAVVSAFLNNTPVVVIFIPIMVALAEQMDASPSKVMMPLSFIAVLGGMTTLIGSSTNLLTAGVANKLGLGPIEFFDFVIPGAVLASVGMVYCLFILPRLLPDRSADTDEIVGAAGRQFIAQIEIGWDHPLIGKAPVAGMFRDLPDMTVRMIQRREQAVLPPFDDVKLIPGDVVILATTRKALEAVLARSPEVLGSIVEDAASISPMQSQKANPEDQGLERIVAEAVIAPGSRMIGRNLEQIGLRYQTGCITLGIQRRSRMIRTNMNDIRLEPGDVLLVVGKRTNVQNLRNNKDLLLLEWSTSELPSRELASRAGLIFAAVVASAATGLVPIVVAAILGAAAMIGTGCLNIRQASRAIDRRIFLIVGTALAMGTALMETGGAGYLANGLVILLGDAPVPVILSAFFLLVAVMTNVLSNNATAVLFTPIGVSLAYSLQVDPMLFVYAVIFAANCSFATPMAYQTNLLVMGPGHHTFADFMRGGTPLIILLWLVYSFFAPWYYGV